MESWPGSIRGPFLWYYYLWGLSEKPYSRGFILESFRASKIEEGDHIFFKAPKTASLVHGDMSFQSACCDDDHNDDDESRKSGLSEIDQPALVLCPLGAQGC